MEVCMPGGRPRHGTVKAHPELAEISAWFRQALVDAGYASVHAFVQRHPFDKNQVYGFINGARFLTLESCQALAVALRREQAEVEPLWWRAKRALERAAVTEREAATPKVTSWAALPWPPAVLQDILEAQAQAVETLPYRLLGVEPPPLSAVYVRQQARTRAVAPERPDPSADKPKDRDRVDGGTLDAAIPITEALNRAEHLVITGEPGAGKSTFGQYLVLRLAQIWLRHLSGDEAPVAEPVVPLRIPARTLVGARSWVAGLAQATQHVLGMRLVAEPPATLFEHPVQGVRWLVIVDGLDEIVDRTARSTVIQALAARCRPGADYRIVVTTRQLPDIEFAPLRTHNVEMYSVEPFGRDELQVFARRWFAAQGSSDLDGHTARFLRQTDDGRLRELVRNPLLATIAAIAATLSPDRPLPTGRLELYERFFEHLLDDEASGRDTKAELRRMNTHRPARARFASWLYDVRVDLLRHLGRASVESEQSLQPQALAWVEEHAPTTLGRPRGWEDDTRAVLTGTGLLIYEANQMRFLHQSYAEFLAAQSYAAGVGPDFDDLDAWIARGLKPAERDFVLFLFAQWCRQPGHDLAVLIEPLLKGAPERTLLAGRLMAEIADASDEATRHVVDRLLGLATYHAVREDTGQRRDAWNAAELIQVEVDTIIDVVAGFVDNQHVIDRLTAIAEDGCLRVGLRIAALRGLGRIDDPDRAGRRLATLADRLSSFDLLAAGRAAIAVQPAAPLGLDLLRRCATEVGYDFARTPAAAELVVVGDTDCAESVARDILVRGCADFEHLCSAAESWLSCLPADGGARPQAAFTLVETVPLSPAQRGALAETLVKLGHPEPGRVIARVPLQHPELLGWGIRSVVAACMTPDSADLDQVFGALRDCSDLQIQAQAVRGFADAGCVEHAIRLARCVVADSSISGFDLGQAILGWLAAGGEPALRHVHDALLARKVSTVFWLGHIVGALAEAGHRDAAVAYARDHLAASVNDAWEAGPAVDAWLAATGPAQGSMILSVLRRDGPLPARTAARVAEVFARHGCFAEAVELADAVLATSRNYHDQLLAMIALVLARGHVGTERAITAVEAGQWSSILRIALAEHIASTGHLAVAQKLWCTVLTRPIAPLDWVAHAASRLVMTGGSGIAASALTIDGSPTAELRRAVMQSLADAAEPLI
jgi:hypothetical protein